VLASGRPTVASEPLSANFSPWFKPPVTPLFALWCKQVRLPLRTIILGVPFELAALVQQVALSSALGATEADCVFLLFGRMPGNHVTHCDAITMGMGTDEHAVALQRHGCKYAPRTSSADRNDTRR